VSLGELVVPDVSRKDRSHLPTTKCHISQDRNPQEIAVKTSDLLYLTK
jgi:hypothetical protein